MIKEAGDVFFDADETLTEGEPPQAEPPASPSASDGPPTPQAGVYKWQQLIVSQPAPPAL